MYLGIDVGTSSVKAVCLDAQARVVCRKGPAAHGGHPAQTLASLLGELPLDQVRRAAVTGAGKDWVAAGLGLSAINPLLALSRAFAHGYPKVRTIIEIGGRDSRLVSMRELRPGEDPIAVDASQSSLCAAGTGSFLDQQALRLGFTPEELGRIAAESDSPADVSGRCSVFAKTDLVHLQQSGTPERDMLAGLCYAVVRTFKSSVSKARRIEPPVAFCGGVARNQCVCQAVRDIFDLDELAFLVPEHPQFVSALGSAYAAMESSDHLPQVVWSSDSLRRLEKEVRTAAAPRHLLPLSRPTHAPRAEHTVDSLPEGEGAAVFLGVDIGSTSTKAAAITQDGRVVARRYLWTSGRPIEAVRRVLREIGGELGPGATVNGIGTTGSGRYLIGDFIGADLIKNEITAQATASIAFDPQVDTVFEIGGQDSKFICIENGTVVDFAMNKVCAAGTGSFLSEQAERMGINVEEEFGARALAAQAPIDCGERCTVFMETDVSNYLASGASVDDLCAGLAYSIVRNYLSKVADRAKIGSRVLFQGAVAYNRAVVAAFERELGQEVRVTPDNDISGCIGVALLARDAHIVQSRFRGFREIAECRYEQGRFTCQQCENRCDVRRIAIEGRAPLFYGDRCDRYQTDKRVQSNLPDLFHERAGWLLEDYAPEPRGGPLVGIPRALLFWELLPYWRTFLRELGARTLLSTPTRQRHLARATDCMTTESCMPVKAAVGHVAELARERPDFLFLPTLVDRDRPTTEQTFRYNCPFVQVWGHVARAGIDLDAWGVRVLDPVIYPSMGPRLMRRELRSLARRLGLPESRVERARRAAAEAQAEFRSRLTQRGQELLADLPGGRGVVLAGRPYNTCDPGLNLDLPRKLRKMGVLPIPMDMLPADESEVLSRWPNMFWHLGRRLLAAARAAGQDDRLDLIYVTNFRCGPDSFLTKFTPEAMRGKPYLQLEFDDHSADAGVVTRLEAFLDSRRSHATHVHQPPAPVRANPRHRGLTVYLPHMGDMVYGAAAAARGFGVNLQVIPTDPTSFDIGMEYASGKECLPYILCVGNMVKTLRSPEFDRRNSAFFMASSAGPCRFGQYEQGMRRVLDDLGYQEVEIISMHQTKSHTKQFISVQFGKHVLRGLVAVAELERLARQLRPYEVDTGAVDHLYSESLNEVCAALERRDKPYAALSEVGRRFARLPTQHVDKPIICVVGENYVRNTPFANCHIVRKLEALDAVVLLPTFLEWIHHLNHCMRIFARERMGPIKRLGLAIARRTFTRIEYNVREALAPADRDGTPPHVEALWENAMRADFVPFFGDASLSVGLAVHMAQQGVDGLVNVMPFTCMPGAIARSQLRRAAPLLGGMPVLDLEFDGRGEDFIRQELEMFMEQIKELHRQGAHKERSLSARPANIGPDLRRMLQLGPAGTSL